MPVVPPESVAASVIPPAPVTVPVKAPVNIPIEQPKGIDTRIRETMKLEIPEIPAVKQAREKEISKTATTTTIEKRIIIRELNITLPGVSNGEEFVEQLKKLVGEYDV
jgi:hypothetical protein